MPRVLSLLLIVILCSGACSTASRQVQPTAADLQSIKRLAVVVTGDDPFSIVAERAEGTGRQAAIGGMVGGLLGGAIVAGIASHRAESKDKELARSLADQLNGFSPHRVLAEAFARALQESGQTVDVIVLDKGPGAGSPFDAVAEFRIEQWGIRRAISDDPTRLAGFVKLKAQMAKSANGEPLWRESDTVLGHGRYDLGTYRTSGETLLNELRGVAADAGQRMAIRLLYPKETAK